MFSCKRCGLPLYIESAELKDRILKMDVSCLRGHKSVRRLSEQQATEIAEDLFQKITVCLDCGSTMTQITSDLQGPRVEADFLCPIHGVQGREYPSSFLPAVGLLDTGDDVRRAIINAFKCDQCGRLFAVRGIDLIPGGLELEVRCPNGHRNTRYVPNDLDSDLMTKIFQLTASCDKCGLLGHIGKLEERKRKSKIFVTCPIHGDERKDIPNEILSNVKKAIEEISPEAVVGAMLVTRDCNHPLAIRSIEETKTGFKFKCICPIKGHSMDREIPIIWNEAVKERITAGLLTCSECGLMTQIIDSKKSKKSIDFKITCPIHGVMERSVTPDIFKYVMETKNSIDQLPSIIKSLSCEKCRLPSIIRDVEHRQNLTELEVDCKNGHRSKRFFAPDLDEVTLVALYKNLYRCPECYEDLELVYIEPQGRESRVVLLCSLHGKHVVDIPPEHAGALHRAYEEIQKEKIHPPVEAAPEPEPPTLEPTTESVEDIDEAVVVLRGCEIIGGKFDYKCKVKNDSGYVITNVTVSIVAYPQDCMELAGESVKTISRIEVDGFRSPQFTLYPTKDCVQGKIVATVSFIDFRDQLHTIQVEPYLIRSVCDLLKPLEATSKEFDLILTNLTKTQQEQTLDWNAKVLFTKAEKLLPSKNFHIVDTEEKSIGGQFIGLIRGYAQGKYTGKKVAVVFLISGPESGRHSQVKVEALGEDIAMLPTTIDELAETMDSWICLRCGAPLDEEQISELHTRLPIRCRYCAHSLTIALYLQ